MFPISQAKDANWRDMFDSKKVEKSKKMKGKNKGDRDRSRGRGRDRDRERKGDRAKVSEGLVEHDHDHDRELDEGGRPRTDLPHISSTLFRPEVWHRLQMRENADVAIQVVMSAQCEETESVAEWSMAPRAELERGENEIDGTSRERLLALGEE